MFDARAIQQMQLLYGPTATDTIIRVARRAYALGYAEAKSDHGIVTSNLLTEADEAALLAIPHK